MNENDIIVDGSIDVKKAVKTLWNRKFLISFVLAVVSVSVIIYVKSLDNIYESRAILKPNQAGAGLSSIVSKFGDLASIAGVNLGSGGGDGVSPYNMMNSILNDLDFLSEFVSENKFEPHIFEKFDKFKETEDYRNNRYFFIKDSLYSTIKFVFNAKTGLMTLSYEHKDPAFAKKFLDALLLSLSNQYKEIELQSIQKQIDSYKAEIDKAMDISIKNNLAQVVTGLVQKKVVSQAQKYYGFDILVAPRVADPLDKLKPRRSIICIVAFVSAFIIISILVLFFDGIFEKYTGKIDWKSRSEKIKEKG